MPIVGGLDIHRKQITFDYLDTATGEVKRGQIAPADRAHLRSWLARFAGRDDVAFALEGCTGWRYVAEELAGAGVAAHVAEPADTAFARGRKRHAKTDRTDSRHLRELLAEGRLPECWIPPSLILECRALLETYHDLRAEHTAWVQRIHAVFFHQGAPALGEAALRTDDDLEALRATAAAHLSPAGQLQVDTCGCRQPVSPGQMHCRARSRAQCRASRSWSVRTWDDVRLVGLRLIFLTVSSVMSLFRLSHREEWWKDAEILMLRHQLAVALRERPRAPARLTWPDRAWLALLAGMLPVDRLAEMRLIVTPGTILRWQRNIVRRRWARRSRRGRSGRPATHRKVRSVTLQLARENESWGYRRIHGELAGLGITVAPSTVWRILKDAGIGPAPRRDGPGWAEFLLSQAQGILALDFFTADLLNGTKVYVLAVIEHGTRRIRVLGATENPAQSWVVQQARNLLMDLDDAGMSVKFVLHDRDASFTAAFNAVFQAAGARVIRSAVQAPRMNSIMERWIGSCRRELLDRTLVWNQRHLMTVLREYEDFYNTHRPHRTLNQAAPLRPLPDGVTGLDHFRVRRRDRAGGVIHEYRLVA